MKKKLFLKVFLIFTFFYGGIGYSQCSELIFNDEFNGSSVDLNKWVFDNGDGCPSLCGWGNAELQYYRTENTTVQNGNLVITAKNESFGGYQYTSSKLITSGKFNSRYGRYEASIKLPSAGGIWPAFWMLPEVSNWPFTGEIDIMEAQHSNPESVGGTVHYNNGGHQFNGREYQAGLDLSEGFHEYAVEWEPEEIRWYVDDQLYHIVTPDNTVDPWPFTDGDWYLILNVAVGGPGTPFTGFIPPTPGDYPTQMEVDYVRVYSGTFNTQLTGDNQVFEGDTNEVYSLTPIDGASYNWSVPAGATIVSGQGTNSISVNWGTVGGDITVTTSVSGCGTNDFRISVVVDPPRTVGFIYEDFQSNRNLTYTATTSGDLAQSVANPGTSTVNNSSTVGRYQRDGGSLFDVLFMESDDIGNSLEFVSGKRAIWMEVYSDAPVGTELILQLENSSLSSGAYPSGRHSRYTATTTTQNQWETIEFELFDQPDAAVGAFDIDQIALLIDPNQNTDHTIYFDNVRSMIAPDEPILDQVIIANYDGVNQLNPVFVDGTYTANVSNPGTNNVNNSANVARYERNGASPFDVVSFSTGAIDNSGPFKNGDNIFFIDVYTSAATGTSITISLENNSISEGEFPLGRNSQYTGVVAEQNAWHTIAFTHASSPDAGTSDLAIDEISVLFDPNSNTSDTYYFDNFRYGITVLPDNYTFSEMIQNYNGTNNLAFNSLTTGAYTANVNNPSSNTINGSSRAAEYVRDNGELFDVLFFDTDFIEDASDYVAEDKRFAMDVFTSAPVGTIVSWQLEASSIATPANFPSGRHSVYQATVKEQNSWHTLEFQLTSTPDLVLTDAQIDTVVLLFDPNNTSGDTFLIDNLRSLVREEGNETQVLSSIVISPSNNTIDQGQTMQFTAQGFDQNGEVFDANLDWTATGGTIDADGLYTGSDIGIYTIAASSGSISASVSITVVEVVGSSFVIPGIIQAEDYKEGGEGVGYSDTTTRNIGGAYREDAVDIQTTRDTDGGDFNVGWIAQGEWLAYDVNAIATTNTYDVSFRVASPNGNGRFHLEVDGVAVTDVLSVPDTNNWQNYETVTVNDVSINSGNHELRVVFDNSGLNINFIELTASAGTSSGNSCNGLAANNQYSYEISSDTTNPTLTFVPEIAGMGDNVCILFYGTSPNGALPGRGVTPNQPVQINANQGDKIYFYYTYSLPGGGENNTANARHDFVVGSCNNRSSGIDSEKNINEIVMFPNPVDDALTISNMEDVYQVSVYTINGKQIQKETVDSSQNQMTINTSSLSNGLYLVKVYRSNGENTVHKISKQ